MDDLISINKVFPLLISTVKTLTLFERAKVRRVTDSLYLGLTKRHSVGKNREKFRFCFVAIKPAIPITLSTGLGVLSRMYFFYQPSIFFMRILSIRQFFRKVSFWKRKYFTQNCYFKNNSSAGETLSKNNQLHRFSVKCSVRAKFISNCLSDNSSLKIVHVRASYACSFTSSTQPASCKLLAGGWWRTEMGPMAVLVAD